MDFNATLMIKLLLIIRYKFGYTVPNTLISQQSGTSATTQPQQLTDVQCKKCGKINHSTVHCHKKVNCKQCKGKDHITKFCTAPSQQELKCNFCGKNKHSTENCKARKKAEKKLEKELRAKKTPTVASTAASTMSLGAPPLSQAQPPQSHQQAPVIPETMQQVPLQTAGIEERLQCLANGVNPLIESGLLPPSPAPLHIHLHEVRMDNVCTLLQVQHILYPLQHLVCIGTVTIKSHIHLMKHPPRLQVHLWNHT